MGKYHASVIGILSLIIMGYIVFPCLVDGFQDDRWIDAEGYNYVGVEMEMGNIFSCVYEVVESKDILTDLITEGGMVTFLLVHNNDFEMHNSLTSTFSEWLYNLTTNAFHTEIGSGGEWNVSIPIHDNYVFVRINPSSSEEIHLTYEWSVLTGEYLPEIDNLMIVSYVVAGGIVLLGLVCCGMQKRESY